MLKVLIQSMRPAQWYKNLVIFACIIFSLNLFTYDMWLNVSSAFIIFCMLSGGEYIINDIIDIEADRIHPRKSKRPIASGVLKKNYALFFAITIILIAFFWAYSINTRFFLSTIAYFLLILSYSLLLKRIVIVDVIVISIGFVIRAVAGCLAANVAISSWLILCAFCLALYLALGKRRYELILLKGDASNHRKILEDYSVEFLDQMIMISTTLTIISYSLYTFLAETEYMMLTIPIVIYGLLKYLKIIYINNEGGDPELALRDRAIMASIALWIFSIILLLYGRTILK